MATTVRSKTDDRPVTGITQLERATSASPDVELPDSELNRLMVSVQREVAAQNALWTAGLLIIGGLAVLALLAWIVYKLFFD